MGLTARAAAAWLIAAVMLVPSPAYAWGFAGHRLIMGRAIDLLPSELKPFYTRFRDEIVLRVTDPDLWRNVGWADDPNHFLDFGAKPFGPYPFSALPRDYGAALEKFGATVLDDNGRLPWRAAEMYGHLRRGFEGFTRNNAYVVSDVVLFSAVTSHYIQDAHQPLHATINYDGAQTSQQGIHARFERDLIERFERRLTLAPPPLTPVTNPRDFAFDTLLASYTRVDALLKADKDAAGARENYDDAYYDAFFAGVRPLLEERLSSAITATASVIVGAWQEAGRPVLRTESPRPVQRVRRP